MKGHVALTLIYDLGAGWKQNKESFIFSWITDGTWNIDPFLAPRELGWSFQLLHIDIFVFNFANKTLKKG